MENEIINYKNIKVMKKVIVLLVVVIWVTGAMAQPCPEYGIDFFHQSEIDNFQNNYPGCTYIIGPVHIQGDDITNLFGLSQITSISDFLYISFCPNLTSLEGLEGLTTIGSKLEIYQCDALTTIEGLSGLTSIGFYLVINDNDALTSLSGLEGLTSIEAFVNIWNNPELTTLTGLNGLTSIETSLHIAFNNSLINLTGLEQLSSVGNLKIEYNESLTSLTGLENLNTLTESLDIEYNNSLSSLIALQELNSIGELLYIEGNDALTSLAGLDSVYVDSIQYLSIYLNSTLSDCDVYSICHYLSAPSGTMDIYNNAPGCDNIAEVEEHCLTDIDEKRIENGITIIPNPSNDKIIISSSAITGNTQLSIFNVSGEKVIERQLTVTETQLDISTLPRGVYFVRVQDEKGVQVAKMVKE